jgi:uncharacterized protein YfaS (alpha-2-macroglobulin family)
MSIENIPENPASSSPQSAPGPELEKNAKSSGMASTRRPFTFWAPMLLAVVAIIISGMLWEKLSRIQGQLARQSADSGQQSLEAKAWAKQAQDSVKDSAARMALVETRLGEAALQRSQLEDLIQSLSRSRDENLVLDIESSLRLAQQQAQLTRTEVARQLAGGHAPHRNGAARRGVDDVHRATLPPRVPRRAVFEAFAPRMVPASAPPGPRASHAWPGGCSPPAAASGSEHLQGSTTPAW